MATHQITETQKAIVTGQNTAMEQWPTELSERQNLIGAFIRLQREQDEAISKAKTAAKDKVGADGALKKLVKDYAYESEALKVIRTLDKMTDPQKRSRVCRQVYEIMKDQGYLIPELFDLGAVGNIQAGADDPSVFDKTGTGKAQGGKKSAPKPVEQPAAQAQTGTGPGLDLGEAQAALETYLANNPRKPGAKPKALKELEAAVELAKLSAGPAPIPDVPTPNTPAEAAANAATIAAAIAGPDAPDDDDEGPTFPELPAADGPLAPQLAAGVAESEAHIKNQIKAGENAAAAKATPAADKPKRLSKALKEAKAKADAEAAAKAAPAGPDAPDEDEGPQFSELPPAPPAAIGGKTPSTIRFAS